MEHLEKSAVAKPRGLVALPKLNGNSSENSLRKMMIYWLVGCGLGRRCIEPEKGIEKNLLLPHPLSRSPQNKNCPPSAPQLQQTSRTVKIPKLGNLYRNAQRRMIMILLLYLLLLGRSRNTRNSQKGEKGEGTNDPDLLRQIGGIHLHLL